MFEFIWCRQASLFSLFANLTMENSVSHNPEDVQAAFATYLAENGVNINSSSSSSSNASNNNNNDEVSMNQVIPPAFGNVEKDKDEKLMENRQPAFAGCEWWWQSRSQ